MTSRTRAELFLLSITFVWGSTFVITKDALQNVSPFLYTAIRFTFAALLLGLAFFKTIFPGFHRSLAKGGILGALLFIGFMLQTIGLQYTTASKSAFITGLLVVLTPICQIVIEHRPPALGNLLGVLMVTVGLYLLTSPQGSAFNVGDLLTLGCALCFALYIVYLDIFSQTVNTMQLTFSQFSVAGLAGLAGSLLFEEIRWSPSSQLIGALAYLTVFATLIALLVQTKYQKETTPTRAAVIFSAEPVIAAVFAYFVFDEKIGMMGVVGGGMMVAGMLISELSDILFPKAKRVPLSD
jgi:drug/metabolite transporter (DMT)-like permease